MLKDVEYTSIMLYLRYRVSYDRVVMGIRCNVDRLSKVGNVSGQGQRRKWKTVPIVRCKYTDGTRPVH